MNRCIHCWRCRRFYQEFSGYRDLGAMQIGNRTYFGRSCSGALESPFSGNLIDVCPTGVFTDKPARYKGRRWDYQRRPTVCIHCSLGCGLVTSARYRQVARQEARVHPAVNGWFVCDRGRHGFHYASLAERPRQARVQAERAGFDDALAHSRERLAAVQAAGVRAPLRSSPPRAAAWKRSRPPPPSPARAGGGGRPYSTTIARPATLRPRSRASKRTSRYRCAQSSGRTASWSSAPTRCTRPPCSRRPCGRPRAPGPRW